MKKDIEGKEINVGDKVVFIHDKSNGIHLYIGTVLKEDETKIGKPLVISYCPKGVEEHTVYITSPSKSIYVIK